MFHPNPNEGLPGIEPVASNQRTASLIQAAYLIDTVHIGDYMAYLIDTVHIGDYIDLTGGARFDRFASTFTQDTYIGSDDAAAGSVNYGRTDNVTSPRASIVYKAAPNQNYYFSYGTSFDPSAEALSLDSGTAGFGPVKATTYEVGAKTNWLNGALTVTAALFRTELSNAQISDPERPGIVISAGNQKVDGFEVNVSGHITDDWEILAGYIFLDPITVGSTDPANRGKLLVNTARHQANLWTNIT